MRSTGPRKGDLIAYVDDPEHPVEVLADGEEVPAETLDPNLTPPCWSTTVLHRSGRWDGDEQLWLLQAGDYVTVDEAPAPVHYRDARIRSWPCAVCGADLTQPPDRAEAPDKSPVDCDPCLAVLGVLARWPHWIAVPVLRWWLGAGRQGRG